MMQAPASVGYSRKRRILYLEKIYTGTIIMTINEKLNKNKLFKILK